MHAVELIEEQVFDEKPEKHQIASNSKSKNSCRKPGTESEIEQKQQATGVKTEIRPKNKKMADTAKPKIAMPPPNLSKLLPSVFIKDDRKPFVFLHTLTSCPFILINEVLPSFWAAISPQ